MIFKQIPSNRRRIQTRLKCTWHVKLTMTFREVYARRGDMTVQPSIILHPTHHCEAHACIRCAKWGHLATVYYHKGWFIQVLLSPQSHLTIKCDLRRPVLVRHGQVSWYHGLFTSFTTVRASTIDSHMLVTHCSLMTGLVTWPVQTNYRCSRETSGFDLTEFNGHTHLHSSYCSLPLSVNRMYWSSTGCCRYTTAPV